MRRDDVRSTTPPSCCRGSFPADLPAALEPRPASSRRSCSSESSWTSLNSVRVCIRPADWCTSNILFPTCSSTRWCPLPIGYLACTFSSPCGLFVPGRSLCDCHEMDIFPCSCKEAVTVNIEMGLFEITPMDYGKDEEGELTASLMADLDCCHALNRTNTYIL